MIFYCLFYPRNSSETNCNIFFFVLSFWELLRDMLICTQNHFDSVKLYHNSFDFNGVTENPLVFIGFFLLLLGSSFCNGRPCFFLMILLLYYYSFCYFLERFILKTNRPISTKVLGLSHSYISILLHFELRTSLPVWDFKKFVIFTGDFVHLYLYKCVWVLNAFLSTFFF